jgi:hypothetical protein
MNILLYWVLRTFSGLWSLILTFLTSKSIFFLASCKISDQRIYHTTILILEHRLHFWAQKVCFRVFYLQKYSFSWSIQNMTYFIFKPPWAQPRNPVDSKFYWARYLKFGIVFSLDANMFYTLINISLKYKNQNGVDFKVLMYINL